MLSGLHAPNAALTSADFQAVRLMAARSVKLMATEGTAHTPSDLLTLRSYGVEDFTVRLRDTREAGGRYVGAEEYVARVVPTVRMFYAMGVRRFSIDNEPNVPGMWDQAGYGPWQYQFFMRHVVGLLRAALPPDVVLISPPLSFSPGLWSLGEQNPTPYTLDDWLAAYHYTDGGRRPSLWRIFDEVGANVYWQSERQMIDPSYGQAYEQLHARSAHMPVCVLEYGNSAAGPDAEWQRRVQYPAWISEARASGAVSRAYLFIAPGATHDWHDFRLTDSVAAAIGHEEAHHAATASSGRNLGGGRGII